MRLVDLAWAHDPRTGPMRHSGRRRADKEEIPGRHQRLPASSASEAADEEQHCQKREPLTVDEKLALKRCRAKLRAAVQELGLLILPVDLEAFLACSYQASKIESLLADIQQLASRAADEVTEVITETEDDASDGEDDNSENERDDQKASKQNSKRRKTAQELAHEALTAKLAAMSAQASPADLPGSTQQGNIEAARCRKEKDEKPAKEKRTRRKTARQLAQEAIFAAMREAGLQATESRLSPELAEERENEFQEIRREAWLRRQLRQAEDMERRRQQKAEAEEQARREAEAIQEALRIRQARREARRQKEAEIRCSPSAHEDNIRISSDGAYSEDDGSEDYLEMLEQKLAAASGMQDLLQDDRSRSISRSQERRQKARERMKAMQQEQVELKHEEALAREREGMDEREQDAAEREAYRLKQEMSDSDPVAAQRLQWLIEFARIGSTEEAAAKVMKVALETNDELKDKLQNLQDLAHAIGADVEGFIDDFLSFAASSSAPLCSFFELGVRPRKGSAPLSQNIRRKAKRARWILRASVKNKYFSYLEMEAESQMPIQNDVPARLYGERTLQGRRSGSRCGSRSRR